MKIGFAVALLFAIVGLGAAAIEWRTIDQLQQERDKLKSELASQARERLEASKRACAENAEHYFQVLGYTENGNEPSSVGAQFTDHYSSRLGRCLMALATSSFQGQTIQSETIFDVEERQEFGTYAWVSSDTRKFWEQPPITCKISLPGEPEKVCHSTDEWNALKSDLMNS